MGKHTQINEATANSGSIPNGSLFYDTDETSISTGITKAVADGNYANRVTTTTDNAIARFDGVAGSLQNSTVTIDDSGNVSVAGSLISTASGGYWRQNNISGNGNVYLDVVAGQQMAVMYRTGQSNRWFVGKTSTSESGSDAGSNFLIYAYNDSGTGIGNAVEIERKTRNVTIASTLIAPTLQLNGSTSGTVQLVAPAVAGTVTQTMGVGYQYVQTLYYTTVGTATFTKATYPWLRAIRVKCVGGGGGGGGSGTDGRGGSGGGGGGCTEKFITDISGLASSITVTVGDGGNGGTAGNNNGSAGSNSSFATSTSIVGNGGGAGLHPAQDFPYGGDGGSGSGGDITFTGGGGGGGQGSGNPQAAGMGGSSILGGGGKGAARQNGLESVGVGGNLYGGGGGGGARFNTNNVAGGKGAQGIVIVELYA